MYWNGMESCNGMKYVLEWNEVCVGLEWRHVLE